MRHLLLHHDWLVEHHTSRDHLWIHQHWFSHLSIVLVYVEHLLKTRIDRIVSQKFDVPPGGEFWILCNLALEELMERIQQTGQAPVVIEVDQLCLFLLHELIELLLCGQLSVTEPKNVRNGVN